MNSDQEDIDCLLVGLMFVVLVFGVLAFFAGRY